MKLSIILIFIGVLNTSYAQTGLFVGPSVQFNYFDWNNKIIFSPAIGGLFGIQQPVFSKHSINTSLNVHWSKHRKYDYGYNAIKQIDVIFDLRSEARLFFIKKYPQLFFSFGLDLRLLRSYNYYPDYFEYSKEPFHEFAVYGIVSIGREITIVKQDCSYSITTGLTNWDREYLLFFQLNLLYHFGKNK